MSIQNHSKPSGKLYIVSVHHINKSKLINTTNHLTIKAMLACNGIWHKEVIGVYKGGKEKSFILKDANIAYQIATQYNQESLLELSETIAHGLRRASLKYISRLLTIDLGYFRDVPKDKALRQDSYTLDNTTGKYYTTIKDYTKASQIQ